VKVQAGKLNISLRREIRLTRLRVGIREFMVASELVAEEEEVYTVLMCLGVLAWNPNLAPKDWWFSNFIGYHAVKQIVKRELLG